MAPRKALCSEAGGPDEVQLTVLLKKEKPACVLALLLSAFDELAGPRIKNE